MAVVLSTPDRLPLGPAAQRRRVTTRDDFTGSRQKPEPIPGKLAKLLARIEVDAKPRLGPVVVPDREAAESIPFDDGVIEVDLGRGRVDSQEEQPAGAERRLGLPAVLKDLKGDQ